MIRSIGRDQWNRTNDLVPLITTLIATLWKINGVVSLAFPMGTWVEPWKRGIGEDRRGHADFRVINGIKLMVRS